VAESNSSGADWLKLYATTRGDNLTQFIAISGLTAAGKTTHSRLLAKEMGWECLHATDVLLREMGRNPSESRGIWFSDLRELEAARDASSVDDRVDSTILARLSEDSSPAVIDSWSLPWYGPRRISSIWIGSDRLSRTWKCQVSRLPQRDFDVVRCAALIDEKDLASRVRFIERYGIDIFSDRQPFDFVLDNSHLITSPTEASSAKGIAAFHQVVMACAKLVTGGSGNALADIIDGSDYDLSSSVVALSSRALRALRRRSASSTGKLPTRIL